MLDPRIDLANMLFEMREKLNEIEMKLWEIPHHEEPVEEYEAVFTAPAEGDYMHPAYTNSRKTRRFFRCGLLGFMLPMLDGTNSTRMGYSQLLR